LDLESSLISVIFVESLNRGREYLGSTTSQQLFDEATTALPLCLELKTAPSPIVAATDVDDFVFVDEYEEDSNAARQLAKVASTEEASSLAVAAALVVVVSFMVRVRVR
jgi:hypothetical protein